MTAAELEKRVRALEKEVGELRRAVKRPRVPFAEPISSAPAATSSAKPKKLSPGLRQALKEVAEGKVSGPFDTIEEFIADLES